MIIKIVYIENDDLLGFKLIEELECFVKENTHDKFLALSLQYSSVKFIVEELSDELNEQSISIICKKIIFHELYELQMSAYRDYYQYWVFIKNNEQEWEFIETKWCLSIDFQ